MHLAEGEDASGAMASTLRQAQGGAGSATEVGVGNGIGIGIGVGTTAVASTLRRAQRKLKPHGCPQRPV